MRAETADPPERLHIVVNAADGYRIFQGLGINAITGSELTASQVQAFLAAHVGRLHRFGGWVVGNDNEEVLIKVNNADAGSIKVTSSQEPPFEGTYGVASEPPPFVSQHGDYIFDLQLIT